MSKFIVVLNPADRGITALVLGNVKLPAVTKLAFDQIGIVADAFPEMWVAGSQRVFPVIAPMRPDLVALAMGNGDRLPGDHSGVFPGRDIEGDGLVLKIRPNAAPRQ